MESNIWRQTRGRMQRRETSLTSKPFLKYNKKNIVLICRHNTRQRERHQLTRGPLLKIREKKRRWKQNKHIVQLEKWDDSFGIWCDSIMREWEGCWKCHLTFPNQQAWLSCRCSLSRTCAFTIEQPTSERWTLILETSNRISSPGERTRRKNERRKKKDSKNKYSTTIETRN